MCRLARRRPTRRWPANCIAIRTGTATELRRAIGARFKLDPARIVCGAGSDDLIYQLCLAYGGPGRDIVMSEHGFAIYHIAGTYAGSRVIKTRERNLTADVDAMLAAVSPATRLVFLANPNNPTGSMLPYAEVARLRAGLPPEVLLVLDAAYAEYVERPDYDPGIRLVDAADNTVMLRTFSKIFGLGGMRIGWCYAPPAVLDVLNRVRAPFNVSIAAQAAAIAALAEPGWVEKGRAHNAEYRPKLAAGLQAAGIKVWPCEGNFVLADFVTPERAKAADALPAQPRRDRAAGGRLRPAAVPADHRRHRRRGRHGHRHAGGIHAQVRCLTAAVQTAGADRHRTDRQLGRADRTRTRRPCRRGRGERTDREDARPGARAGLRRPDRSGSGRAVEGADCVMLCAPVGAFADLAAAVAPHLAAGAILTDVGSTKQSVIRDVGPLVPAGVHFVPAHPVAGTEYSGPDSGFTTLFQGRWALLTPPPGTDEAAVAKIEELWRRCGSMVQRMEPGHHDRVLAIVSHLPHLIAFTICGTADDLADESRQEVLQFSASGFRDFTRIAASDPVMWRDIFLNNREALLEMLARFMEDAQAMSRAVRWGDAAYIEDMVERGRKIRRSLIEIKQA